MTVTLGNWPPSELPRVSSWMTTKAGSELTSVATSWPASGPVKWIENCWFVGDEIWSPAAVTFGSPCKADCTSAILGKSVGWVPVGVA